jgi:hypothetical protein
MPATLADPADVADTDQAGIAATIRAARFAVIAACRA